MGDTVKATVVTRVTIAAAPAMVFTYLTDLRYHHLWNPQVRHISKHGKLSLGTSFENVSVLLGIEVRSKNVVTKFQPPTELEMTNRIGLVHYKAHFYLKPSGKGTQVVLSTVVTPQSNAFAFATPILKSLARRELQTDMQALKLAVEHQLS